MSILKLIQDLISANVFCFDILNQVQNDFN